MDSAPWHTWPIEDILTAYRDISSAQDRVRLDIEMLRHIEHLFRHPLSKKLLRLMDRESPTRAAGRESYRIFCQIHEGAALMPDYAADQALLASKTIGPGIISDTHAWASLAVGLSHGSARDISCYIDGVPHLRHDSRAERAAALERDWQADAARDVFGPHDWRLSFVGELPWDASIREEAQKVAADIYAREAWSEMPVLGDLIEDAGYPQSTECLHARSGCVHVRGCWLVEYFRGRNKR